MLLNCNTCLHFVELHPFLSTDFTFNIFVSQVLLLTSQCNPVEVMVCLSKNINYRKYWVSLANETVALKWWCTCIYYMFERERERERESGFLCSCISLNGYLFTSSFLHCKCQYFYITGFIGTISSACNCSTFHIIYLRCKNCIIIIKNCK